MKNYYVMYEVIGSRCTGSYFVKAETKREAKKKVQAIDEDYCRIRVLNEKEYADEFSMEEEDVIPERKVFEAMMGKNGVYHIESGT